MTDTKRRSEISKLNPPACLGVVVTTQNKGKLRLARICVVYVVQCTLLWDVLDVYAPPSRNELKLKMSPSTLECKFSYSLHKCTHFLWSSRPPFLFVFLSLCFFSRSLLTPGLVQCPQRQKATSGRLYNTTTRCVCVLVCVFGNTVDNVLDLAMYKDIVLKP